MLKPPRARHQSHAPTRRRSLALERLEKRILLTGSSSVEASYGFSIAQGGPSVGNSFRETAETSVNLHGTINDGRLEDTFGDASAAVNSLEFVAAASRLQMNAIDPEVRLSLVSQGASARAVHTADQRIKIERRPTGVMDANGAPLQNFAEVLTKKGNPRLAIDVAAVHSASVSSPDDATTGSSLTASVNGVVCNVAHDAACGSRSTQSDSASLTTSETQSLSGPSALGHREPIQFSLNAFSQAQMRVSSGGGRFGPFLDEAAQSVSGRIEGGFDLAGVEFVFSDQSRATASQLGLSLVDASLPLSPAEIVTGAISTSANLQPGLMFASFTPNYGLSLAEAANLLGVDHFNWIQTVVGPGTAEWRDSTSDQLIGPAMQPIYDPINTSNSLYYSKPDGRRVRMCKPGEPCASGEAPDKLKYYLNEGAQVQSYSDTHSLLFTDTPRMPKSYFDAGDELVFETQLVGVIKAGTDIYKPLGAKFRWKSDAVYDDRQGPTGPIIDGGASLIGYFAVFDDDSLPDLLEGGISDVELIDPPTTDNNMAPVADAGPAYAFAEGDGVSLDASASSDPDGDTLTYEWDLNGDGAFSDASGPTPTLSWAQLQALGIDNGAAGAVFPITVLVRDGGAVSTAVSELRIANTPPQAAIAGPTALGRGQSADFVLSAADPSEADLLAEMTYMIDWDGDGSQDETVVGGAAGVPVAHVFDAEGQFDVAVTATDQDGGLGAAAVLRVQVFDNAPPQITVSDVQAVQYRVQPIDIQLSDDDSPGEVYEISLTASGGWLRASLNASGGVPADRVEGNETGRLTLQGSLEEVRSTLATAEFYGWLPATETVDVQVTSSQPTVERMFGVAVAPNDFAWHNAADPRDVDQSGEATTEDLLAVLSDLLLNKSRLLAAPAAGTPPSALIDVDRDGFATTSDLVDVVAHLLLLARTEGESGESASLAAWDAGLPPRIVNPRLEAAAETPDGERRAPANLGNPSNWAWLCDAVHGIAASELTADRRRPAPIPPFGASDAIL